MTPEQQHRLLETADRIEIADVMHRYAWGIDFWDWAMLDEVFDLDVEGDFSSVKQYVGGDGIVRGREAIVGWLRTSLLKFPDVLHFMSNHMVQLRGDAASVTTYMHVMHMPMGGIYHCEMIRRSEGWRISRFRLAERTFNEAADRLTAHMSAMHIAGQVAP